MPWARRSGSCASGALRRPLLPPPPLWQRHTETTWVHLASGGTEIVCLTRTNPGGESVLLRTLPNASQVNGITAHCLLHTYYGREFSTINKIGPLTAEQVDRLRPRPPVSDGSVELTPPDHGMLTALGLDGRATYHELTRSTGWSQSTVQRRLTELRRHGLLYFDVDYAPQVIGCRKLVILWLAVAPSSLNTAGEALAQIETAPIIRTLKSAGFATRA